MASIGPYAIAIIRPETLVRWHRAGFPANIGVESAVCTESSVLIDYVWQLFIDFLRRMSGSSSFSSNLYAG